MDITRDSHIHTNYSPDAVPRATFQAYINKALELGLTELTFTDHVDIDAVHPLFHQSIDYDSYLMEFRKIQNTSPIPLRLGVEIGYQQHVKQEIIDFISKYSFDFVILSTNFASCSFRT